jgi:peptide/nickel transport system substrate-binding protein
MRQAWMQLSLAVLVATAIGGCKQRSASPNLQGDARQVLVVATQNDSISLDPAVAYEFTSTAVALNLYDTLIRYENGDYTRPLPHLAQTWKVSPDGRTWRFLLRKGLRFASGQPLDAAAVRYSLVRTLKLKMGPSELLADNLSPERIHVLSPRVIEFRLEKPCAYFLSTLFNPAAAVVDPSVVEAHAHDGDLGSGWLRDHSAGSGPFVLKSWERDISMVLEANPSYWGEPPALRRVIIKDVQESTTQKMLIERGDIDIAYDLNPLQIADTIRHGGVTALEVPFLRLYYLGMNAQCKPLDDVRVRHAIRYALRYRDLLALASGHALPLQGTVIRGLLGYAPQLGAYRYNPRWARNLLARAGYSKGFTIELATSGGPTPFGPTREDLCAKIQSDLAEVGIKVKIKTMSSTAYLEMYRAHKTQLNLGDWGADYPDPHNFIWPFAHSKGTLAQRVQYTNPSLDPLIDQASHTSSPAQRVGLYRRIQERLMRTGPWAVLLQPTRLLPVRREVHEFHYDYLNPMSFASVYKGPPDEESGPDDSEAAPKATP